MAQKISLSKYKKIIMLALVLVSIIICVFATYISEYNLNKVSREDVLTMEMTKNYKSSEEFLENFSVFNIYLSENIAPYKDGETLVAGKQVFTVNTVASATSQVKGDLKITIGLGANWIKFISKTGSNEKVEVGSNDEKITINNIETTFPAKGDLWFVTVDAPTLYVLVEWSEKNNSQYYTYLEYDYETYSQKTSE